MDGTGTSHARTHTHTHTRTRTRKHGSYAVSRSTTTLTLHYPIVTLVLASNLNNKSFDQTMVFGRPSSGRPTVVVAWSPVSDSDAGDKSSILWRLASYGVLFEFHWLVDNHRIMSYPNKCALGLF